jgi:hypothetical protein
MKSSLRRIDRRIARTGLVQRHRRDFTAGLGSVSSTSKSQKSSAEGSILRRFPIPGGELVIGRGLSGQAGAFVRPNAAKIPMNGRLIDSRETYKPSKVIKRNFFSRPCGFKKRPKK